MRPLISAMLMIALLLLAPLPFLAWAIGDQLLKGGRIGLFTELMLTYVVLLAMLGSAAPALAIYHFRWGAKRPLWRDIARYVLVGAAGSTLFMLILDYADDYFSRSGIGWTWPTFGAVVGASFGGAYRILYHWLGSRDAVG